MGKWKDAINKCISSEDWPASKKVKFGHPATAAQLEKLEAAFNAKIPQELKSLLLEFNGVKTVDEDGEKEVYYFSTSEMANASQYYADWDNELAKECCQKIMFVCQENGMAEMWGVVAKPFGDFKRGDLVALEHDRIQFAESEEELFTQPYESLQDLLEATIKDAD
jgi:cell wall assembly regulator SMI1